MLVLGKLYGTPVNLNARTLSASREGKEAEERGTGCVRVAQGGGRPGEDQEGSHGQDRVLVAFESISGRTSS